MFKHLAGAWADIERDFLSTEEALKFPEHAKRMVNYGKDMFYMGAYTSMVLSNCIARYITDEDDALAKLNELKSECTEHFEMKKPTNYTESIGREFGIGSDWQTRPKSGLSSMEATSPNHVDWSPDDDIQ